MGVLELAVMLLASGVRHFFSVQMEVGMKNLKDGPIPIENLVKSYFFFCYYSAWFITS